MPPTVPFALSDGSPPSATRSTDRGRIPIHPPSASEGDAHCWGSGYRLIVGRDLDCYWDLIVSCCLL